MRDLTKLGVVVWATIATVLVVQPGRADEPDRELSALSVETLDLFRELYRFRNHRVFHRYGFSPNSAYGAWRDRLESAAGHARSFAIVWEIGYGLGALRSLATAYMNNGGCPADMFTRAIEKRFLQESGVSKNPCRGCDGTSTI